MKEKYTSKQKKVISKELKRKFASKSAKGHEIVITLIAMANAGRIDLNDIEPILTEVFDGDFKKMLNALKIAHNLIDDELIDSVIKEVESLH